MTKQRIPFSREKFEAGWKPVFRDRPERVIFPETIKFNSNSFVGICVEEGCHWPFSRLPDGTNDITFADKKYDVLLEEPEPDEKPDLSDVIQQMKDYVRSCPDTEMDDASFDHGGGLILSGNECKQLLSMLKSVEPEPGEDKP